MGMGMNAMGIVWHLGPEANLGRGMWATHEGGGGGGGGG